jgi:hypothetical protein
MPTATGQRQARVSLARQQFAGFRTLMVASFFVLNRMTLR